MQKRIFRLKYDFQEEERWLNEMAAHGWMMKSFFLGVYHMEEGPPGAYVYRMELLPRRSGALESQQYLRFLEETGIEVVATWWRWVYLRRKAEDGAFDLYSDTDSRIALFRRVFLFLFPVCCLEWILTLIMLVILLVEMSLGVFHEPMLWMYIMEICVLFLLGLVIFKAAWSARKQYVRLKKDKQIKE